MASKVKLIEAVAYIRTSSAANVGAARHRLLSSRSAISNCKFEQLDALRRAAWERENEDILRKKCGLGLTPQETQAVTAFFQQTVDQKRSSPPAEKEAMFHLYKKSSDSEMCRGDAMLGLTIATSTRWREAPAGASLPPLAQPDAPIRELKVPGIPLPDVDELFPPK